MPEVPRDERDPQSDQPAETPTENSPPERSHAGPFRREIASTPAPGEKPRRTTPVSESTPTPLDRTDPAPSQAANSPAGAADATRASDPAAPQSPPGDPGPTLAQTGDGWQPQSVIPATAVTTVDQPQQANPAYAPERVIPRPLDTSAAAGASTSTTGLPHYSPPASSPPFSAGPAAAGAIAVELPAPRHRTMWRPLGRGLREMAETIILALLIFLLVRAVVQNFQVEGRSMEPTFESQWYVLVNKALYWEINMETVSKFVPFVDPGDDPMRYLFRGPKRGDVVVFKSPNQPSNGPERDFIKRVIALPGETVEVRDCTVFINGEPLDEPYIREKPSYTDGPHTVPPDHLYVLGDNRNNSSDSSSWGMLPKENLIGQAWLIYWPFSAFGLVDNTSVTPGDVDTTDDAGNPATGKPAPACT